MKKKFDDNDVLKFLYGELSPADHDDFVEALCCDDALFETYEELKSAHDDLGEVGEIGLLEPSEDTMDAIMDYVQTTARPSVRERVTAIGVSGKKVPVFGMTQLVSALMVCFTLGFVWFSIQMYGTKSHTETTLNDATGLEWDSSSLSDHLDRARMQLDNLAEDREVPYPVHHNTYRLVNSNLFSPAAKSVILLNIR